MEHMRTGSALAEGEVEVALEVVSMVGIDLGGELVVDLGLHLVRVYRRLLAVRRVRNA
jgi:hypothetical protein